MTKTRSTKSALISSVVALLLCFAMLVGSTFAWFTDSVTSAGNIIQSGTLDVEMHWAEGKLDPNAAETAWTDASTGAIFNNDKWEPGYVEVRHIKISNVGTLALKYQLHNCNAHLHFVCENCGRVMDYMDADLETAKTACGFPKDIRIKSIHGTCEACSTG